jgi:hypothetical protein
MPYGGIGLIISACVAIVTSVFAQQAMPGVDRLYVGHLEKCP